MQKSKLYGLIGSTLSSSLILLILWFVVLSAPSSTETEGFLVGFGDSFDGGGSGYVPVRGSSNNVSTGAPSRAVKTTAVSSPSKQALFTQSENSVTLDQQKEKDRVSKVQNEINVQRIEEDKRKADKNRKEQAAINKANAVNGLFGNNGSSGGGKGSGNGIGTGKGGSGSGTGTGKGTGSGSGNGIQGNPAGKGPSGVGSTFKLGNRNYFGNPAKPNYPKDVEGKITVNIRVNENGMVTSASIGSPTTISDSEMRRGAISAANRTRFTAGKNIETGSITYNYRLE